MQNKYQKNYAQPKNTLQTYGNYEIPQLILLKKSVFQDNYFFNRNNNREESSDRLIPVYLILQRTCKLQLILKSTGNKYGTKIYHY